MKRRSQRLLLAACTVLAVAATLSTAFRAYGQPAVSARDVAQLRGELNPARKRWRCPRCLASAGPRQDAGHRRGGHRG